MKRICKMLVAAMTLALVGCRENGSEVSQESEVSHECVGEMPRRHVVRIKRNVVKRMEPATSAERVVRAEIEKAGSSHSTVTIKELSKELTRCAAAGTLTRDNALQLLEKHLGTSSFVDAFSDMSASMTSSDAEERIAALKALSVLKGEWQAEAAESEPSCGGTGEVEMGVDGTGEGEEIVKAEGTSDGDETISSSSVSDAADASEIDDPEQRAVYTMMTLGLQDGDATVRDAAYETLQTLPDEERSALSLQLMGNDDATLKERLLEFCADDDSAFARSVVFHGLDADEASVRSLAENRVMQLTGRSFASSDEAFSWYEQRLSVGE